MKEKHKQVMEQIDSLAEKIYYDLEKTRIPALNLPTRSKSNIMFDDHHSVWKYGTNTIERSAKSLNGAYMLLRTMYMADFIKEMIKTQKSSTLREMYYISEGWDLAKFHSQNESNLLAEDLEVITNLMREDFKLRPEEDGARVIGDFSIQETTRNNTKRVIHCQDDVGDSGYSIPYNVEKEKLMFKNINIDFLVAVETGGMFDRLVENHFDENYHAGLVHLKGQPARSTRRFIKRLNEEKNLPVVVFTDCDPWSFRIFASVAYGAIKTAHISEYLATPSASYLGVTPSDIENYQLPTDDLTNEDIKSLKSELSDPRFNDTFWKHEIKLQLKMNKKSEQQALAKYGLDYVTDTYLPEKLTELGMIKK
jgi:DNA topoisomerase VI subunit A